ncbi:MAG: dihydrofolate reductase family protein [Gammaproteobacteria bacterium]
MEVTRLYPPPAEARPLAGLYLNHELQRQGSAQHPFVYSNFIASLDGRISEPEPDSGRHRVPAAIANSRDWRLYMELAAQADVLLTTARHLRAVAEGRHAELIEIGHGKFRDLASWRASRGLAPQPAIAVVSAGLEIPAAALRRRCQAPLLVLTTRDAPAARVRELQDHGIEVTPVGEGTSVDGDALVRTLAARGLQRIYSIAGPRVLHTLLAAGRLDRLYLTLAQAVIGGDRYHTLTAGPPLTPAAGFQLHELHLDAAAPPRAGQLLASFDARPSSARDQV